jgi:hypothetical protein
MGRDIVTRILAVAGTAVFLAVVGATAAPAQTATTYCVNGSSTTLPTTITFAGGSRVFTEGFAEIVFANSFDQSTFYLGFLTGGSTAFFLIPDGSIDPNALLEPGYSVNTIRPGACTGGRIVGVPGRSFMCAAGYGEVSTPDFVAGKEATEKYLEDGGRHYSFFVQGDLNGPQRAQAKTGGTPAGSFYCRLPQGLRVEPIMGPDGKQMLADTEGALYPSSLANGETIGHPAYRLAA